MDVVPSRAPFTEEDSDSEAVNMPGSKVIVGVACVAFDDVNRWTTSAGVEETAKDIVPLRAPFIAKDRDSETVNRPGSIVITGVACGEVNKVERSTTV